MRFPRWTSLVVSCSLFLAMSLGMAAAVSAGDGGIVVLPPRIDLPGSDPLSGTGDLLAEPFSAGIEEGAPCRSVLNRNDVASLIDAATLEQMVTETGTLTSAAESGLAQYGDAAYAGNVTVQKLGASYVINGSLIDIGSGSAVQRASATARDASGVIDAMTSLGKRLGAGIGCPDSGAWSGTVTYTEKTRLSDGEGSNHSTILTMEYEAAVQFQAGGSSEAQVKARTTSETRDVSNDPVNCASPLSPTPEMRPCHYELFESFDGNGTASGTNVGSVEVDGNSYTISLDLPNAEGKFSSIKRITESGGCGPSDPVKPESLSGPWDAPGRRYAVLGTVDRSNPNHLSGSKTDGDLTVTWDLSR